MIAKNILSTLSKVPLAVIGVIILTYLAVILVFILLGAVDKLVNKVERKKGDKPVLGKSPIGEFVDKIETRECIRKRSLWLEIYHHSIINLDEKHNEERKKYKGSHQDLDGKAVKEYLDDCYKYIHAERGKVKNFQDREGMQDYVVWNKSKVPNYFEFPKAVIHHCYCRLFVFSIVGVPKIFKINSTPLIDVLVGGAKALSEYNLETGIELKPIWKEAALNNKDWIRTLTFSFEDWKPGTFSEGSLLKSVLVSHSEEDN